MAYTDISSQLQTSLPILICEQKTYLPSKALTNLLGYLEMELVLPNKKKAGEYFLCFATTKFISMAVASLSWKCHKIFSELPTNKFSFSLFIIALKVKSIAKVLSDMDKTVINA